MKQLEHIVDIGSLSELIDVLEPQITHDDDYNEEKITWQLKVRMLAAFKFESGSSENIDTEQVTAHQSAKLTIRYLPGITHKHRIVRLQDMTDWDIDRIHDDGRRRFHFLTLKRAI